MTDLLGHNSKMKNTPEDEAVADGVYRVTASEIRQFIERCERLESREEGHRRPAEGGDGRGQGAAATTTKALRKVSHRHPQAASPTTVAEEEAVLDMYKQALGM
jgi:uncharacterized protein (UPF0335 family)